MCGIVGTAGYTGSGLSLKMARQIEHRGPDGEGYSTSVDQTVSIGMRRLAIIDLETGDQPFYSEDKKVHLVFNGEIYNFKELRAELLTHGASFNTRSDTEVILQGFLMWGQKCWKKLQGMFTIAIIDEREIQTKLILVRDRVGIKPLYYRRHGQKLAFASEIKSLLVDSSYTTDINLDSISKYLSLRYVPGGDSLFKEIKKFPAASVGVWQNGEFDVKIWWTPAAANNASTCSKLSDASRLFGDALSKSVKRHMISDVPVGLFLSGGVDSNIILALMTEFSEKKIKTFSIGFPENKNSDTDLASISSKFFGTEHYSLECTSADMSKISDIAYTLDEPIGDPIVVAMSVLSQQAAKYVKVVLSGEGADELLGGYMFHRKLQQMALIKRILPDKSFQYISKLIDYIPEKLLNKLFDYPGELGSDGKDKVSSLIQNIGKNSLREMYISSISLFDPSHQENAFRVNVYEQLNNVNTVNHFEKHPSLTPLQALIKFQYSDWLPDDILMKSDKLSMAHSLEVRVPFLDELVINAAIRIKDKHKLGFFQNKLALRKFAEQKLPSEIINASKRAFYVPLESYMTDQPLADLSNWALDPYRIRKRGIFNPEWVLAERQKSAQNGFLPNKRLFSLVMLEVWFDRFAPEATWN